MNNAIRINQFNNKYDNLVKSIGEVTWNELCELFSAHQSSPRKESVAMFNLVRYREDFDPSIPNENTGCIEESSEVVPLRRKTNVVQADALVLDYDGDMSIEAAKQRFKDYEYFAYTSYNHLKNEGVEKFRLILPLVAPIPFRRLNSLPIYEDFADAILELAGPCDPVVLNLNQHYFIPATHPDRLDLATTWRNSGKILDWREWPVNAISNDAANNSSAVSAGVRTGNRNQWLNPDTEFHTEHGLVKAKDVDKVYQKVTCPFHADKKGSELLKRFDDSGVIYFHCKHCGGFALPPEQQATQTPTNEQNDGSSNEGPLIFDNSNFLLYDYSDPSTFRPLIEAQRVETNKKLRRISSAIRFGLSQYAKSHIVYLPEGSGKSQLAIDLVRMGECVIFACQTWDQVFEKHRDFSAMLAKSNLDENYQTFEAALSCNPNDFSTIRANQNSEKQYNVEMALSLDALVRLRWNVKLARSSKRPGYKTSEIDIEKSFEIIKKENPAVTLEFFKVWWNIVGGNVGKVNNAMSKALEETTIITRVENDPDVGIIFEEMTLAGKNSGMVITTFSQLRLLGIKGRSIPRNWLVWFDDPGLADVANISPSEIDETEINVPLSADEHSEPIEKRSTGIRMLNGTRYYSRPEFQSLGASTKRNRMVFTTTELLTKRLLQKHLGSMQKVPVIHDEMMSLPFGRITIIGTEKVRRKFDAIIPIIARYLCKGGNEVELIANGLGSQLNHVNSKGSNVLADTDILVEVSIPHPSEIRTLCDILAIDFASERDSITHDLMLDKIHQAIGRNSGYRWQGNECIVLVDKLHHARIINDVRYGIDRLNSVIIDKNKKSTRLEKLITESASALTKEIEEYLNRFDDHICDGRSITHAIDHVVQSVEDGVKRINYLARLLAAMTSLSKVRLDSEVEHNKAESHTIKKYRSVWKHIHEKWIAESIRDKVMAEYLKIIRDKV